MVILKVKMIVSIFLLLLQYGEGKIRVDPLVQTKLGLIRGLQATDGDYAMFLGIPYAKVDEANPFGPSLPYPEFETEYKAFDDTSKCPQMEDLTNAIEGSLDCLHLNVYVPNSASFINRLPVMVWIYGGNFERGFAGRALYGPKFLVRHDVILVTINHRVGLYGYMCLHTPEVPGNQGLKDQVAALRWIRDNIEAFGGDFNKITVFGESSGGRSIDFHVLSPQEQLFHNAILQSGTSLTRDTIYEPDLTAPIKLAEKLGYATYSMNDALRYLATVEPHEAIAAAAELQLVIKPCIEKDLDDVEKFITDYTINRNVPKAKSINFIVGYNDNEQVARYADKAPEYFSDLNIIYDRLNDYFDFNEEEIQKITNYVHRFYLGDKNIHPETMWEIIDFDSCFSYVHPAQRTMDIYAKNGAEYIFYYVFSYTGGRNFYKQSRNVTVGGASHADELGYLFDMQAFCTDDPEPADKLIIDKTTTLWTNFAKYGNPTPEETELLPFKWEAVTEDIMYYYDIDTKGYLGNRPFHTDTAFWDLFYKIYWKYQRGYKDTNST